MAAPLPRPIPRLFSPIYPFSTLVWFLVGLFIIVSALALWVLSRVEAKLKTQFAKNLKTWSIFGNSLWYCFGTMMGEAITRDTKSEKTTGLRCDKWTKHTLNFILILIHEADPQSRPVVIIVLHM